MNIAQRPFGYTRDGRAADCFVLSGAGGLSAEVLTYGGAIRTLQLPVDGIERDVVLGFDRLEDYEAQDKYMGQNVGRVANQICGATFSLDGQTYQLDSNSPPHCLHGGRLGLHQKLWCAEPQGDRLVLTAESKDGEGGFPGRLRVRVSYRIADDNTLFLEYFASTDRPTPVSLTNHSYFNLNGHDQDKVIDHHMQICAGAILASAPDGLPTGMRLSVVDTPFDFRVPRPLGSGLTSSHPMIGAARGYDHNYIIKDQMDGMFLHAAAAEAGGLRLDCYTTQPGLQLYTGNYLDGVQGKDGAVYGPQSGFCLEAQNWPDAVNHPDFPSTILLPGERYHQITAYHLCAT